MKVGGSLFDRADLIITAIREHGRPVLIVPGGGRFADTVRRLRLTDDEAHWMAVAAMEQYGWYLASRGANVTEEIALPRELTILLPYCALRRIDPLPHSWDVTSDTISAWVAWRLGLELVILKSIDGIHQNRVLLESIDHPVPSEDVDPCLMPFVFKHNVRTTVINGRDTSRIRGILDGQPVPGTVIHTRF